MLLNFLPYVDKDQGLLWGKNKVGKKKTCVLRLFIFEKRIKSIPPCRSLLDGKASTTDLEVLEAQLLNYSTKKDLHHLEKEIHGCAKSEDIDRLLGIIKKFEHRFDDYAKTEDIERQLKQNVEQVERNLSENF